VTRRKEGATSFTRWADVMIIIFRTHSSYPRTGFQLSYTSTAGSSPKEGKHVILSNAPQTVTHIAPGTNLELSTFIFAPQFSFDPCALFRTTFDVTRMDPGQSFVFAFSLSHYNNIQYGHRFIKR